MVQETKEIASRKWYPSTCPHDCSSVCALDVEVIDGDRLGKVRGSQRNTYTAGVICAKVSRYHERLHHPDRLMTPLKRTGEKGEGIKAFIPVSWEEALDSVANALIKAEQKYGAETVWPYFYAGTMGFVQRDGIERLRHVMGYSRQETTICTTLVNTGWEAGVGASYGVDAREMAESDLIVIWGCNPVNTKVNIMTHIAKARKGRGAKLVVIDPYRTGTAQQADLHLAPKPGTDAALVAAVIHILMQEGHADLAYLSKYTDWNDEAAAHYGARTPEWAASITGLDVQEIYDFARLYGATRRSFLVVGYGFSRSRNGSVSIHAVSCLPAITGAWQYKGGGALKGHGAIYTLDNTLIKGLDHLNPDTRLLDMSRFGPVLTGDKRDLGEGPPVTALFVQNSNPAVVCPESLKCREGLLRDDLFTCVHEQFMTDTAKMADIVLPATMFLEHDDFYVASGHTYLQVTKQVLPAPGQCKSNHDLLCALAERLGAKHRGFKMTAWEIMDETLKLSGYESAEDVYISGGADRAESFEKSHFLEGFPHKDGKFHFRPNWQAMGKDHRAMPTFADYWPKIDLADKDHPFRLVAAPARQFLNSSFTETPTSQKREGRPQVMLNPVAAQRLGIEDGMRVRLGNRLGSLVVHAKITGGQQEDVVVVESIWPNDAFEEGIGINALTSADRGYPNGGAVFHDTAVWIKPA